MSILDGIGALVKKVCEYIPTPEQKRRNKIERIKREIDELRKIRDSAITSNRMSELMRQLRIEEEAAKNK